MGKILDIILVVFLLGIGFVSCGDDGCMENRSSIPLIAFYSDADTTQRVAIDSLTVWGIGQINDSLLLDTASVNQFMAPLRDGVDTTKYVLRYDQENLNPRYKFDTLTFVYHSYVKFDSAECGAMFNYVIDDFRYTTHQLVSATLLTKEIDNLNIENVKLFYHVEEAE